MRKSINKIVIVFVLSAGSCQASVPNKKTEEAPIQPRVEKSIVSVATKNKKPVETPKEKPVDVPVKIVVKTTVDISKENTVGETTNKKMDKTSDVKIEKQRTDAIYSMWDAILQANVTKKGIVNYEGIKADPNFEKLVRIFSATDVSTMSKAESKVFWINAYNLFTIKLIVDNWSVKSIMDIASGKPWDVKFIHINGKTFSLNNIENDILRKKYADPRIHFAINCASYSCPLLYNRSFFVGSEESILNTLAKNFVNDTKRNKITATNIEISSIFDWYKTDFTKNGTIIDFLNKYSNIKIQDDAKVSYMTYNWNLNNK